MLVQDIAAAIEQLAPLHYQESYDNSGLCIGSPDTEVKGILLCIDITEEVLIEAKALGCNMVISHHPLIFSGIKKITGKNFTERCILYAIKNELVLYSSHTNLDAILQGVNQIICNKLALINCKILRPIKGELSKIVTFVPEAQAEQVRQAIFNAGGGCIGNYDSCSYNVAGQGTFKANEFASPFVGTKGNLHTEAETRIEVIVEKRLQNKVVQEIIKNHPYEEVAYDIYPLENSLSNVGAGMIGELANPVDELEFLQKIKNTFQAKGVRHTTLLNKKIKRVAICGGSGSSLLSDAIQHKADIYISADFKYHQFFDAENKILIADIGHFESEQYTKEIIYNLLVKNFPKFAVHFSKVNTNPINYL